MTLLKLWPLTDHFHLYSRFQADCQTASASRALALSTAAWPIEPNGRVSSDRTGPLPRLSPQQQLHFSEQPRGNDYQHGQAQNELPGRVDAATALTAAMRAAQPCQGWGRGFESHLPLQ